MLAPLLVSAAFAAAPAAHEPCATRAPLGAVEAALAGAEAAWGVDEAAFSRGVEAARAALRCVAVPVPPTVAARTHRVEGLAAFLVRDEDRARAAFAAARALDPAYTFPAEMVPARNPLRVLYDASAPAETTRGETTRGDTTRAEATRALPPPARGVTVWVDGAATRDLPTGRAAVVQVQPGPDVAESAWVLPGEPLPDYRVRGEGTRLPVLIGAGALAAGAGVLWALGADARGDALGDARHTDEEWRALQDRANTLGAATVGVGAAAVLTGAGAFVFARW